MKRISWSAIAVVALAGAALAGCSGSRPPQPDAAGGSLEQAAWAEIARGAALVDVRTPAEFASGHLPGARNIPYDEIGARLAELPADRSQGVVLYCRTGRRSGIAQRELEAAGFTRVINAGGYEEMRRAQPR